MSRTALRAVLILAVALGLAGFWAWRQRAAPSRGAGPDRPRPNIVLVTIDTLRADRVGAGRTPNLDRLAARGLRFDAARSPVPLTLPAHTSIMTGLLPPQHGVRENGDALSGRHVTIARLLRDSGYRTAAFVGAFVLDRHFGLQDGFDVYDDQIPRNPARANRLEAERRGEVVVDRTLAWLRTPSPTDQTPAPFFLWVHLFDPHAPYDPPPEFRARARGDLYAAEVFYADAQLGRLVEELDRAPGQSPTAIFVAGDHGEGLGDHGEMTHGMLVYESTLRVPLVAAAPGVTPGVRKTPVSLVDLAPTLLALAALPPPTGAVGRNLLEDVDAIGGAPIQGAAAGEWYSETQYPAAAGWSPLAALLSDRLKLIDSSSPELYDLQQDPHEQHNLAADRASTIAAMSKRVDELRVESASSPQPAAAPPPDVAERLRALGYVAASGAPAAPRSGPNPAAHIASWTTFEGALSLLANDRADEAAARLKLLADAYADARVFQSAYAAALRESGDLDAALQRYRRLVERWSGDAALYHDLATTARDAGRGEEALRAEQAALAIAPDDPAALNGLGLLHVDGGRVADARSAFERAVERDATNASYWSNLGNTRRALDDRSGARAAYDRALAIDPTLADAANGRGVLEVQAGRAAEAIPWFEQALASQTDFVEARLNLGIAYQESHDLVRAAEAYREVIRAPARFERERNAARTLLAGLSR